MFMSYSISCYKELNNSNNTINIIIIIIIIIITTTKIVLCVSNLEKEIILTIFINIIIKTNAKMQLSG